MTGVGTFDGLLASLDDMLGKLRQAHAMAPLPDDFFTNPRYSHLLVPIAELDAVKDFAKTLVEKLYGTDSVEAEHVARAEASWKYVEKAASPFESYIGWLSRLRSAIRSLPPHSNLKVGESIVTNINIHGSVIGSSVAGRDAHNQATLQAELHVNAEAVKATLEALQDLFGAKSLSPGETSELDQVKASLQELQGRKTCERGIFQGLLSRIGALAEKTLTGTMSSMLTEQVKRIIA